ncbi:DUF680 domain-containing protein [Mesorhizobium sp. CA13]|jgi:hypothetical protein|uniref:DUF680 domain-containing protein n=1 Tax=unclassified Mesorhizobium TaxID=325217 RepID=UPI00112CCBFC|nr:MULTISPECIES: DUF680 domain-containing protein [unclassified Mesorhizobium]MBZ9808565.1 DUF680 domain-containing protein [Mesorhizobium sp. ESP-6-2]MBZ9852550.1 DUF680 domain-containing protein [Mesorhizobium sp. CA13]MBZ9871623.1 DUF680 domain-containing protein [Mesorhizobium sp. BR1-1-9]MBZ9941452.1 DUF680 domain-containing protein [Mesorhizobium sp. BR1-1-13]MCA0012588.1 DUF680 domain-containing protein [Mesorhizobium sp. B294B1A1]
MTKIALTAAAILIATGSAFAGSDNYGSNNVNQPVANQSTSNIDTTHTGSIAKSVKAQGDANANVPAQSGQGIWGR